MSLVFVHIGQCGNQLGQSFWQEMESWSIKFQQNSKSALKGSASTQHTKPNMPYALSDCRLPCILVDSEPKVVQKCARILNDRILEENVFSDKLGRGNNWAYGYHGRNLKKSGDLYGPCCLAECVMENLRITVERCDRFTGTVLFHSLAGGTGAGLGSALLERLRDEYPLAYIMSVLVAPFRHGETPLQHYNSLLCLSWIQQYCDAALFFRNDDVLEQTRRQDRGQTLTGVRHREPSIMTMNLHIAKCLCNAFMPLWSPMPNKGCFEPLDMMRSLCPDQSTKFITTTYRDSSQAATSWDQLIPSLPRSASNTQTKSSSLILVARGGSCNIDSLVKKAKSIEEKLKRLYNTVTWNPFPIDLWLSKEPSLQEKKYVSVLANCSVMAEYLESVHEKAKVMFDEKAYVHWYQKYNCDEYIFHEAFDTIQTVIGNYKSL